MLGISRLGPIAVVGLAALTTTLGGCGGGSDGPTDSTVASRPGVTSCRAVAAADIGDAQLRKRPGTFDASFPSGEGRVEIRRVNKTKVIRRDKIADRPRVVYEAPGTFLVVTYEMTNLGSETVEPQRELNDRFFVLAQDGHVYGDVAAGGGCSSDVSTAYAREHGARSPEQDLSPGESVESVAVYSLPTQANNTYWVSVRNGLKTPLAVGSGN